MVVVIAKEYATNNSEIDRYQTSVDRGSGRPANRVRLGRVAIFTNSDASGSIFFKLGYLSLSWWLSH